MKKPTKYAAKEAQYFKCFFTEVYEIADKADDNVITSNRAVEMINSLIANIEDLTVETPIQDYENSLLVVQNQFDISEAEYIEREMDLDTLLTKFHKELRK